MTNDKIDPNKIKVRDWVIYRLICGAVKSGLEVDEKKKKAKRNCRRKVSKEEEQE